MAPDDGTKRARLRAVRWALGSIAVVLFAVLVLQGIPAPAGDEFPADANDDAQRTIPNAVDAGSKSVESVRESAASSAMVAIAVHDPEGKPLVAEVVSPDLRLTVEGSGWLPATTGTVTVSAAGHISQDVVIEEPRTDVVLQPSRTLLGFVFDAVTGQRIAGASVSVQGKAGAAAARSLVADDRGEFAFVGLASGEVVVRSTAEGYVPYFGGPSASFPGLRVELQRDHRVELALFPVYVALCTVQNTTNLSDEVLGSLLACSFTEKPGRNLPQWFEHEVQAQMADVSRAAGIRSPYGDACLLDTAPISLEGRVDFVVRGQGSAGSATVTFQPLKEFLKTPTPSLHVLTNRWNVGRLTVEAPIGLRIAAKLGIVFGGLKTKPGTCTYELPHGTYVVSPLDAHPLLDAASWTREVTIPVQDRIAISPAEGFATLEIAGGSQWPDGVLGCQGPTFTMGIPMKDLPTSMPVSPSSYSFYVVVGAGQDVREVWRGKVTVRAGERTVFRIGAD